MTSVAEYCVKQIIRLHRIPKNIVSDKDKVFLSKFWKDLLKLSGTPLSFSLAYHLEIDGHTENINKVIEMYLRAII